MAVQHLTDALIKKLPRPEKGCTKIYDAGHPKGFGVCVTKGSKSFFIRYRIRGGRERCMVIGACEVWKVTEARARARELRIEVDAGGDPLGAIQESRDAVTVAELCERFLEEHAVPRLRESSRASYAMLFSKHIIPALGHLKANAVTLTDVDALHRKISNKNGRAGGKFVANRTVAVLSASYNFGIRRQLVEKNPAKGVERFDEPGRRRYLSGPEISRLVEMLNQHRDPQASDIFRVLLMTGARKGEVLGMRWCDLEPLSAGVWSRTPDRLKQGAHSAVPLSAPVMALLSRIKDEQAKLFPHTSPEYVFATRGGRDYRRSVKRNWTSICMAAQITARIHDLRHTYASLAVGGGASLVITGQLLGHQLPQTTARYAHLADSPLRQVTERIGEMIEAAGNSAAEVIKLRG